MSVIKQRLPLNIGKDDDWDDPDFLRGVVDAAEGLWTAMPHDKGTERKALRSRGVATDELSALAGVFASFTEDYRDRIKTNLRLGVLEKVVIDIKQQVVKLSAIRSVKADIVTLAFEGCNLRNPIPVIVDPADDEFMAMFLDADMSATGDTVGEAVANLKDLIASSYKRYLSLGVGALGPALKKRFMILGQFIDPVS